MKVMMKNKMTYLNQNVTTGPAVDQSSGQSFVRFFLLMLIFFLCVPKYISIVYFQCHSSPQWPLSASLLVRCVSREATQVLLIYSCRFLVFFLTSSWGFTSLKFWLSTVKLSHVLAPLKLSDKVTACESCKRSKSWRRENENA